MKAFKQETYMSDKSENKENKPVGIIGKIKGIATIVIPILVVLAIGWVVLKYINKKKNGEDASVGETVKEGVTLVKKIFTFHK